MEWHENQKKPAAEEMEDENGEIDIPGGTFFYF